MDSGGAQLAAGSPPESRWEDPVGEPPRGASAGDPVAEPPEGVLPLQVLAAGHCARKADPRTKGGTRHVIIQDLVKVAAALKISIPSLGSPCALFSLFEGNPMASEHCAKKMHGKVLARLAKLESCRPTEHELRRAVSGSLLDLDAELRESQPGLEGCGAAVALVTGQRMCVVVAGRCCATLCGKDPASLALSKSQSAPKHRWTTAAPRALTPEAIAAANRATCPDKSKSDGKDAGSQKASFQRLQARNPSRCLGSSAESAGSFGGKKPGALDPTAVKNTRMVAVEKGAGGVFVADDMRLEVVPLLATDHALLILGSSALYLGCTPLELATAAAAHPRDAAAASEASAKLAQARMVHKSTDDANWVKNEKMLGAEVTCIAAFFVWGEHRLAAQPPAQVATKVPPQDTVTRSSGPHEDSATPNHLLPLVEKPAKRELPREPSAEEAAQRAAATAFYSERAKAEKRARLSQRDPSNSEAAAVGPVTADGECAVKAPSEGKVFEFADLDGTAQWRLRMAGAAHMRGGTDDPPMKGAGGGKDGGGGKGKGKGKGKNKGKGKGKGKGKEGKGKKAKGSAEEHPHGESDADEEVYGQDGVEIAEDVGGDDDNVDEGSGE